jgi:Right handed beta helix region
VRRRGDVAGYAFDCVSVGARRTASAALWPAVVPAAERAVYVRKGVAPDGDGSMARPFLDPNTALTRVPDADTLVIARGAYRLTAPLAIGRALRIIGVGAAPLDDPNAGVSLLVASGLDALSITATAPVSLNGITLVYDADATRGAALRLARGADVSLSDVAIERAPSGVVADTARLDAVRLTVRTARDVGVDLRGGSITLRNALVRAGSGVGLRAVDARVEVEGGAIDHNASGGVSLTANTAAPMAEVDLFRDVSIGCNGLFGVDVHGPRTVTLDGVFIRATTESSSPTAPRGDGVVASDGAQVRVTESAIVRNRRTGVLATGDGTELRVTVSLIGSNDGPGIFVQSLAAAPSIVGNLVDDNLAIGVGSRLSSSLSIDNNTITHTLERLGSGTSVLGMFTPFGDGVAISGLEAAPGRSVSVTRNHISNSRRYGVAVSDVSAGVVQNNDGTGNALPLALVRSDGVSASGNGALQATGSVPDPRNPDRFVIQTQSLPAR